MSRIIMGREHSFCYSYYHEKIEHGLNTNGISVDDSEETKVDGGGGKLLGVLGLRERVQVSIGVNDGDLSDKIW
jgi:hypothetical protein